MSKRYYQPYVFPIPDSIRNDCCIIVIVPVYNEESPEITLKSLMSCSVPLGVSVEIIFVINASIQDDLEVKRTNEKAYYHLKEVNTSIHNPQVNVLLLMDNELPEKKAGVGLARKIGMDTAWLRFQSIGRSDGLIVNLDADCTVEKNYITALIDWQVANPELEGGSIFFEHPLPEESDLRQSIVAYELHLRYFIEAQRYVGLPYAFHTVGSAMVVRSDTYGLIGGMNTRKAGEDFYFLQKVISRGRFADITTTTVYPSSRISTRVPFGTGRAMLEHLERKKYNSTYHFAVFEQLKVDLSLIIELFKIERPIDFPFNRLTADPFIDFLRINGFDKKWDEIWNNTNTAKARINRFYHWFDAFMLMKYCHYCRDLYGLTDFLECSVLTLLQKKEVQNASILTIEELLALLRVVQRNQLQFTLLL